MDTVLCLIEIVRAGSHNGQGGHLSGGFRTDTHIFTYSRWIEAILLRGFSTGSEDTHILLEVDF